MSILQNQGQLNQKNQDIQQSKIDSLKANLFQSKNINMGNEKQQSANSQVKQKDSIINTSSNKENDQLMLLVEDNLKLQEELKKQELQHLQTIQDKNQKIKQILTEKQTLELQLQQTVIQSTAIQGEINDTSIVEQKQLQIDSLINQNNKFNQEIQISLQYQQQLIDDKNQLIEVINQKDNQIREFQEQIINTKQSSIEKDAAQNFNSQEIDNLKQFEFENNYLKDLNIQLNQQLQEVRTQLIQKQDLIDQENMTSNLNNQILQLEEQVKMLRASNQLQQLFETQDLAKQQTPQKQKRPSIRRKTIQFKNDKSESVLTEKSPQESQILQDLKQQNTELQIKIANLEQQIENSIKNNKDSNKWQEDNNINEIESKTQIISLQGQLDIKAQENNELQEKISRLQQDIIKLNSDLQQKKADNKNKETYITQLLQHIEQISKEGSKTIGDKKYSQTRKDLIYMTDIKILLLQSLVNFIPEIKINSQEDQEYIKESSDQELDEITQDILKQLKDISDDLFSEINKSIKSKK